MLSISQFFKRIQNKHSKELFVRSVIQAAIKKYAGVEVLLEDITFGSSGVVLKNVSGAARSQVFIKKQAIIAEINAGQDIRHIGDVR